MDVGVVVGGERAHGSALANDAGDGEGSDGEDKSNLVKAKVEAWAWICFYCKVDSKCNGALIGGYSGDTRM